MTDKAHILDRLVDIAEREYKVSIRKNFLTPAISSNASESKKAIGHLCGLFWKSRQSYYRRKWRAERTHRLAVDVVELVTKVRQQLPRVGTRKLQVILSEPLADIGVGRDIS